MTLYEAIFRRKSIRKYRDTEIDPKLLEKIEQYGEDAVGIRPEIRTKWKILKGSDKRLAGLFLVKAPYYVVLYSEICEDYRCFDTDISLTGTLTTGRMNPVQALLSDDDEATSFVKGYGGELLRDGFRVSVKAALGQDRGVSIRYGKNLVGLEVTEDESNVKTRIVCYGKNGSVTLESPHLGDYIYPKIHTLTEENKSVSEVQEEAQALLDGGCDIPSINIKVDFVALEKTVEYREYAVLEEVFLGDMVTVINTKMGFRKQAKVISYEWDCLLEQYNDVELGDFIPTLAASVTSGVKSGSLASSAAVGTAAVMAALQAHLNDFNNPHHVTAAQVQS